MSKGCKLYSQLPVIYYRSRPMSILRDIGPFSDITMNVNILVPVANETLTYQVSSLGFNKQMLGLIKMIIFK